MQSITQGILASIFGLFAFSAAHADPVSTIACYASNGAAVYVGFVPAQKQLTVSYEGALGKDSLLEQPDDEFSENHSYVRVEETGTTVHVVANIIKGSLHAPIFAGAVDILVTKVDEGHYTLTSGAFWHGDKRDLSEFIGSTCYVG